jgi:hypothetical protein
MASEAIENTLVGLRVNEATDEWDTLVELRNEVIGDFKQGHFEAMLCYYKTHVALPSLVLSLMERYAVASPFEKQAFASVICFVLIQDILESDQEYPNEFFY